MGAVVMVNYANNLPLFDTALMHYFFSK